MRHANGTAYCNECKKEVHFHTEDWGIGAYEYWGARGTHHEYVQVCDECGNDDISNPTYNDSEPEWEPDLEDY